MVGFLVATGMVATFLLGIALMAKIKIGEALRDAGLSKESAKLYGRAAKILNRLEQTTDLDGAYAGDVLSDETKTLVTEWMADYRKKISKI